jgi:hypothetical protein
MRPMRRLVAVSLLVSLVAAGNAWAEHQDPRQRLTRADNSRARAMLLRQSDLPGFTAQPATGDDVHVDCARSVSESDLTLTGEAEGRVFAAGPAVVSSAAQIYRSRADANTSWRRSTSSAGVRCAATLVRRTFARQGVRLVSLRKIAFPRIAERTVAYRIRLSLATGQGTVDLYVDLVALQHGRAHATVLLGTPLAPVDRAAEVRLARVVAGRMAAQLR